MTDRTCQAPKRYSRINGNHIYLFGFTFNAASSRRPTKRMSYQFQRPYAIAARYQLTEAHELTAEFDGVPYWLRVLTPE